MLIRLSQGASIRNSYRWVRDITTRAQTSGEQRPVVLRFAPSPTGQLHLGGLRTALFNHLFARKHGGRWILRIEDTDRNRYVAGAVEAMQDVLRWAGLTYDEGPDSPGAVGPYLQSQRLDKYGRYVDRLLASKHAYRDFRPPQQSQVRLLSRSSEDIEKAHVVRLRLPRQDTLFDDAVYGRMRIPFDRSREDPILVKSDGWPTYHLANVVDDTEMGVTHVLRGEEWLASMPIHLALYDAFGIPAPAFVHLPLLVNPDGSKLSKRHADVHVSSYRERGFEPEALLNFVALMGFNWHESSPDAKQRKEVLTIEEMIDSFSLERISQSRACPDVDKLNFLNRQHLSRQIGTGEDKDGAIVRKKLLEAVHAVRFVKEPTPAAFTDAQTRVMVTDFLGRAQTIKDAAREIGELVNRPDYGDETATAIWSSFDGNVARAALQIAQDGLRAEPDENFTSVAGAEQSIKRCVKAFSKISFDSSNVKSNRSAFMKALRFALTGRQVSDLAGEIWMRKCSHSLPLSPVPPLQKSSSYSAKKSPSIVSTSPSNGLQPGDL